MRTLFLLALVFGAAPVAPAQSSSSAAELLGRLPALPDPTRSVVVTYDFTRTTSKYKGTEEQLTARLDRDRTQLESSLPANAAERQQTIDGFAHHEESLMREGAVGYYEGKAEITADYQALAERQTDREGERWDWVIRRGNKQSEYSEFNRSARVSEVPRGRETSLSLFMETVGRFGHLSPELAGQVRDAKSVKIEDGKITVELEHWNVVLTERPDHQLVVTSIYTTWKGDSQLYRFEDYQTMGGVLMPMRVTEEVSTAEFDIREEYGLRNVEIGGQLEIPFKAAKIEAN